MKDYPDRMTPEQVRRFGEDVLNIVSQIPRGRVTTYGHIAALAGWPSHSRMVGRTLRYTPGAEHLPCHRVVNKEGRTAPGWSRQRTLLEEEGVCFKANGHVDMVRHLWEPEVNYCCPAEIAETTEMFLNTDWTDVTDKTLTLMAM